MRIPPPELMPQSTPRRPAREPRGLLRSLAPYAGAGIIALVPMGVLAATGTPAPVNVVPTAVTNVTTQVTGTPTGQAATPAPAAAPAPATAPLPITLTGPSLPTGPSGATAQVPTTSVSTNPVAATSGVTGANVNAGLAGVGVQPVTVNVANLSTVLTFCGVGVQDPLVGVVVNPMGVGLLAVDIPGTPALTLPAVAGITSMQKCGAAPACATACSPNPTPCAGTCPAPAPNPGPACVAPCSAGGITDGSGPGGGGSTTTGGTTRTTNSAATTCSTAPKTVSGTNSVAGAQLALFHQAELPGGAVSLLGVALTGTLLFANLALLGARVRRRRS